MARISQAAMCRAIEKVRALDATQKEALPDELFRLQPHMFAAFLVQHKLGVSLEKMEFLLELLFICFQAMKESGLDWPLITEDEQDRQMARYTAIVKFGEDLSAPLRDRAMHEYIEGHPEQQLLAYVMVETTNWMQRIVPEETDKYVMLTAMNFVDCIAFAPIPASPPNARKNQGSARRRK